MKRPLVAILIAAVIGVAIAGVAGAFSSGPGSSSAHGEGRGRPASASHAPMPMPMPATAATAAAAHAPPSVQLHRAVVKVTIKNFAFLPTHIVVSPGTRIVWTNEDEEPHTVVTDKPGWSSEALETGSSFATVMRRAGTFTYHCSIHPFMHGSVVVES
jgi:plastocyanin